MFHKFTKAHSRHICPFKIRKPSAIFSKGPSRLYCALLMRNVPPVCRPIFCATVKTPKPLFSLAGAIGLEPTAFGFGDRRSTIELHPYSKTEYALYAEIVWESRESFVVSGNAFG